jgi:TatD DNase family protein
LLFNTHTHVDTNRQFQNDRDDVVARARDMGVTRMMVIGYNRQAVDVSVAFAERYDWVWAAVGIHPTDSLEWNAEVEARLRAAAVHPKVRAIGEVGLDYYWKDSAPFDLMRDVFRQQIRLAREFKLPLVIHDRDAHDDTVRILEEEHAEDVGGIMHCFAGDWVMANAAWRSGFPSAWAAPLLIRTIPLGRMWCGACRWTAWCWRRTILTWRPCLSGGSGMSPAM